MDGTPSPVVLPCKYLIATLKEQWMYDTDPHETNCGDLERKLFIGDYGSFHGFALNNISLWTAVFLEPRRSPSSRQQHPFRYSGRTYLMRNERFHRRVKTTLEVLIALYVFFLRIFPRPLTVLLEIVFPSCLQHTYTHPKTHTFIVSI